MEEINNNACSLEHYQLIRETKEYRHTPFSFREHLCKDTKITQTSKIAWMVLSDYSVFSSEYKVHMSLRTLGEKIGKDKRTARRALEELEKYGYIQTNLKNSERGNDKTIIWVRFPQDAVPQILEKPDRKITKLKVIKDKIGYTLSKDSTLTNEENSVVEDKGNFALIEASMPESGALMLPINTNNITDPTITKKTVNNVSSNQDSGTTQGDMLINRLLDVECLFLKFVERANVLKTQELNNTEFENNLWDPYTSWEKQAIQRFNAIRNESTMKDIENINTAIPAKFKYDQEFAKAKASGMSALQASRAAQNVMTAEETKLHHAITWALARLKDILEPLSNQITITKKEDNSQTENSIIIDLNPPSKPISITQIQTDKLIVRLKKAVENGEVSGEASKTDLRELAEQLIFHVEHWSPRLISYKSSQDRANIAANVALKRMKAGTWSAPYGWTKREILQREKEAQQQKLSEIAILNGRVA